MRIFSPHHLAYYLLVFPSFSSVSAFSNGEARDSVKFILGEESLGPWQNGILDAAQAPGPVADAQRSSLVLAAKRTKRPDILHGFRRYQGGWDIANRHYWASVGFTGGIGIILAVLWFVSFGTALIVHHCCGWRINIKGKGSPSAQKICLILLLVFTCAAAIGCILLSVGQGNFHGEVLHTLKYVVNQSDYTVQTLRNVTEYLNLAKSITVAQIVLPSNVMDDIDKLNVDLNTAANMLTRKTTENSSKIKKVFNAVHSALIAVATVMLLLAILGLCLSILGHRHAIHIFIISGWLLVAITFILYGVFVIFNNAMSDTCMAMGQWVDNPHSETALSNILPCVDQRTTNQTLVQSKEIINDIVNLVNQVVYGTADTNPSPGSSQYYNQSGPMMPPLCFPFDSQLQDRQCEPQEVSMENSSAVWSNYVCTVSSAGICTSVGRITPEMYTQLVAAVNASYALKHYTPPLLSLQNCNFVRETFSKITSDYCRPLVHYLQMVNAGLGLISVGVMLCLLLWILYANRPQMEEVFAKLSTLVCGKVSCNGNNNNNNNSVLSLPTSPQSGV